MAESFVELSFNGQTNAMAMFTGTEYEGGNTIRFDCGVIYLQISKVMLVALSIGALLKSK